MELVVLILCISLLSLLLSVHMWILLFSLFDLSVYYLFLQYFDTVVGSFDL